MRRRATRRRCSSWRAITRSRASSRGARTSAWRSRSPTSRGSPGWRERGEQLDLLIVHRADGPIGVIGLSEVSRRDRRAVVGTWLGRRWWGSGANVEAKALVARLAFDAAGARASRRLRRRRERPLAGGAGADRIRPRGRAAQLASSRRRGARRRDLRAAARRLGGVPARGRSPSRCDGEPPRAVRRRARPRRCSQLNPRTASTTPSTVQTPSTPSAELVPEPAARHHRARQAVDQVLERQRLRDPLAGSAARCPRRRRRRR